MTEMMTATKRRRMLQQVSSLDTAVDEDLKVFAQVHNIVSPGLRNLDDLISWPMDVAQSLCADTGDEISMRLKHRLLCGVALNTDYSGLDCPREALEMGFQALLHHFQLEAQRAPVWVGRTCDKGSLQKRLQVQYSLTWEQGARCHFEDILHRLPIEAQEWISAAAPNKSLSKEERREAFIAISDWCLLNRGWLFPDDATCYCCVHNRCIGDDFVGFEPCDFFP